MFLAAARNVLVRIGQRVNKARVLSGRARIAARYLQGDGLEIGALEVPLRLPSGARVRYVDIASREEAIRSFPELDARKIVLVDLLTDGMTLADVPGSAYDFLVANHVLEHSQNPIDTVRNWARVLKANGILFVSVPIPEACFDAGRPITTYDHMLEDFRVAEEQGVTALRQRNLPHYREWLTISAPNISNRPADSGQSLETRISEMAEADSEIHFHTFSEASMREFIESLGETIVEGLQLVTLRRNRSEIIVVAQLCRD